MFIKKVNKKTLIFVVTNKKAKDDRKRISSYNQSLSSVLYQKHWYLSKNKYYNYLVLIYG